MLRAEQKSVLFGGVAAAVSLFVIFAAFSFLIPLLYSPEKYEPLDVNYLSAISRDDVDLVTAKSRAELRISENGKFSVSVQQLQNQAGQAAKSGEKKNSEKKAEKKIARAEKNEQKEEKIGFFEQLVPKIVPSKKSDIDTEKIKAYEDAKELAKKNEASRAAELARLAEEERLAAEKRELEEQLEKERVLALEKRMEEEREAAEKKRIEQELKAIEERRLAEKKAAEEKRVAEQKRIAEQMRRAEEERLAEQKRIAEEKKKVEEERKRVAEERRIAEQKKAAEEKRLAEQKRLAEERRVAEQKRLAEQKRIAEEKKRKEEEAKRLAEAKRISEEKLLAEKKRLEEEKRAAEQKRLAEERQRAEEAKRVAEAKKAAEAAKKVEVPFIDMAEGTGVKTNSQLAKNGSSSSSGGISKVTRKPTVITRKIYGTAYSSAANGVNSTSQIKTERTADGKIAVRLTDGTMRALLSPEEPIITLSGEIADMIKGTKRVVVSFSINANGIVQQGSMKITPDSLPYDVDLELKNQIAQWKFAHGQKGGAVSFIFILANE